jgi:hypothetical protein
VAVKEEADLGVSRSRSLQLGPTLHPCMPSWCQQEPFSPARTYTAPLHAVLNDLLGGRLQHLATLNHDLDVEAADHQDVTLLHRPGLL